MLRTVGSQVASIMQGATRIRNLNWPVTCSARNVGTTRATSAWGGNAKLTWTSEDGWKCSIPWLPEVVDFPRCNTAHIDWYVRMPTNTPSARPIVEMLPQMCEEEGSTLEPTLPVIVSFHIEMVRSVCWKKITNRHVSNLDYINKLQHYYYPNVRKHLPR